MNFYQPGEYIHWKEKMEQRASKEKFPGGATEKIPVPKITLLILYLLYLYHVWKSKGGGLIKVYDVLSSLLNYDTEALIAQL